MFFAHVVVVGVKSNWSLYVHADCNADVAVADFPCNVDSAEVEKALPSAKDGRDGAVVYRGDDTFIFFQKSHIPATVRCAVHP